MDFSRSLPTLRGGMMLRHLPPAVRERYTALMRLKEKVEDVLPAGHMRSLLLRKFDQALSDKLSRPVADKLVEVANVAVTKKVKQ